MPRNSALSVVTAQYIFVVVKGTACWWNVFTTTAELLSGCVCVSGYVFMCVTMCVCVVLPYQTVIPGKVIVRW